MEIIKAPYTGDKVDPPCRDDIVILEPADEDATLTCGAHPKGQAVDGHVALRVFFRFCDSCAYNLSPLSGDGTNRPDIYGG